jgi:5-methylthioadenosine/S-adenosylhomocysteine deaminase
MASFIFENGLVVAMDGEKRIIENGAVVVEGNRIVAVGKTPQVKKEWGADEYINAKGKAIMPGFVTCHNHMYNSLTRYMQLPVPSEIDFSNFGERLTRWWWPKIEETCTKADVYIGTLLAAVEMLKRGITCSADIVEAPNALPGVLGYVAKAVDEVGIRAICSFEATDRLSRANGKLGIKENEKFIKKWNRKKDSRILGKACVHTAFSCHPETLKKTRKIADKYHCGIQLHVAQGPFEVEFIREHRGFNGPVEFLDSLGFLGPDVVAAHGIYLSKKELDILQRNDVKLAFNVKSNMLGGNGVAPVVDLLQRGCTVGLGVDGVNVFDMFELMLLAAALLRVNYLDRTLLSARQVLELATINGAKALGLERQVGSLEVGKKADIITIDISGKSHLTPAFDKLGVIAFSVRASDVNTVMVDGKIIVKDGRILTVDEEKVIEKATDYAEKYQERAISKPISPPWSLPP